MWFHLSEYPCDVVSLLAYIVCFRSFTVTFGRFVVGIWSARPEYSPPISHLHFGFDSPHFVVYPPRQFLPQRGFARCKKFVWWLKLEAILSVTPRLLVGGGRFVSSCNGPTKDREAPRSASSVGSEHHAEHPGYSLPGEGFWNLQRVSKIGHPLPPPWLPSHTWMLTYTHESRDLHSSSPSVCGPTPIGQENHGTVKFYVRFLRVCCFCWAPGSGRRKSELETSAPRRSYCTSSVRRTFSRGSWLVRSADCELEATGSSSVCPLNFAVIRGE